MQMPSVFGTNTRGVTDGNYRRPPVAQVREAWTGDAGQFRRRTVHAGIGRARPQADVAVHTTAQFSSVASRRERVEAIIRTKYPTDSSELRAADSIEYRDLVDTAEMLALESFGQELPDAYVIEMQRRKYQRERDAALQAMTHTFDDGAVVQVRPQDMGNFQTAIAAGEPQEWVMEDNTVRNTTVEELQEAMDSGISQGKTIWNDYASKVKAL